MAISKYENGSNTPRVTKNRGTYCNTHVSNALLEKKQSFAKDCGNNEFLCFCRHLTSGISILNSNCRLQIASLDNKRLVMGRHLNHLS